MTKSELYDNPIQELKLNKDIDLTFLKSWLDKYNELYLKTMLYYSCSHKEPKLPCFCENRKVDCLFLDVYDEIKNKIIHDHLEEFIIRVNVGKKNNKYQKLIINVE